jgi:hypothetical protein
LSAIAEDAVHLPDLSTLGAISVGEERLAPDDALKAARRHCKQIVTLNDNAAYPHSLRGSSCAIQMAGGHFIFCTGHQIADYPPDQIAVVPRIADQLTITCSAAHRPTVEGEDPNEDVNDVRALEIRPENYAFEGLSSEFLPLREEHLFPTGHVSPSGVFYALGFPSTRQKVDYDAHPRIQANQVLIKGSYDGTSANSPCIHRITMEADMPFDPDGMSGGPIYYLGGAPGTYFLGLAGMIVRGSSQSRTLHFIDSQYLWDVATSAINGGQQDSQPQTLEP